MDSAAGLKEVEVPTRWILPRTRQQGIVINVPEMRLYLYPQRTKPGDEVLLRTWAVAIGDDDSPTPEGVFTIRSKDKNPTWQVPDSIPRSERPRRVIPPGPDNPMGEYRIRLSKGLYSIHGTNIPWAIGRQTTHGCIRLSPEDIGEFYTLVKPSMTGASATSQSGSPSRTAGLPSRCMTTSTAGSRVWTAKPPVWSKSPS